MSQIAIGTIMLFASLAILMVLRFPIAYSLGISAVITATYMNIPYLNLFQKMTTGLSSFTFIAVPFFIMMAQVMCDGQITKKLMRMCNIFVGQIRGGTAIVNILVSMLFGNGMSLAYSLAGGILSGAVMMLLKRTNAFSMVAVSIAGGIAHNIGQILVAMLVLQTAALGWYLLVLWVSGLVSGAIIGVIGGELCRRLQKILI